MDKIEVHLKSRSYPIYIARDAISSLDELLHRHKCENALAVISNERVAALHGHKLPAKLRQNMLELPDGEEYKNLSSLQKIYTWLIEMNFDRTSAIIAFGGGVIGDIAGLAAATFMRGVRFIQIPTTLLAQVDAAIGGKTAVNHPLGKNLIGTFYQPQFVLSDIQFLETLSEEEFICGMGEVIKYGLIRNKGFFEFLEENCHKIHSDNNVLLEKIVKKCSEIKADIVEQDEYEQRVRKILNFGHTFGHAFENYFGYQKLKHGQSVILGMICATHFSKMKKFIPDFQADRIIKFLQNYTTDLQINMNNTFADDIFKIMTRDKKTKNKKINLILIRDIGDVFIYETDDFSELKQAFKVLKK